MLISSTGELFRDFQGFEFESCLHLLLRQTLSAINLELAQLISNPESNTCYHTELT